MVLARRCPTGVPAGLCSMFQDGAAVYDTLRVSDEKEEVKNGEVRSYNFPNTVSHEFIFFRHRALSSRSAWNAVQDDAAKT